MQTDTHVQVKINQRQALRNGRHMFTDRFAAVTELLQNGRRAGATVIHVEHDAAAQRLRVADDGCGIGDFQSLLTLHESGWPTALAEAEQAFGVGFACCLYAARCVSVESNGRRLAFDTAAALDQQVLPVVEDATAAPGRTIVTLEGVDIAGLDAHIARMVRGFPVRVFFNGVELRRSHSDATPGFHRTAIGLVRLAGEDNGRATLAAAWYLQGLLVMANDYFCDNVCVNVVHLDPARFTARLPDRRTLIDADQQRRVIDHVIADLWGEILTTKKAALPPEDFVQRYWRAAKSFGQAAVFNDVPLLPPEVCWQVADYPTYDNDMAYRQPSPHAVRREDVEAGAVSVVDDESFEDDNFAALMFVRARGHLLVRAWLLDDEHWVQAHLLRPELGAITVRAVGETHVVEFDGRWVCPVIAFCDAIELRCGDERLEIRDDPLYDGTRALYPAQAAGGRVVRQISPYVGEDEQVYEDDRAADTEALADLVRRVRCADPRDALASLVHELKLERYPQLVGKAFRLAIGAARDRHEVELIG